jgi:cytochrome c-type biogenesis protein CcmH/NrfF
MWGFSLAIVVMGLACAVIVMRRRTDDTSYMDNRRANARLTRLMEDIEQTMTEMRKTP